MGVTVVDRRTFLQTLGAGAAALAVPSGVMANDAAAGLRTAGDKALEPLEFVFFTDTHIEPELNAAHGCAMAFEKIAASKPEFAIMGGDHVFDVLGVNQARANMVFDLYTNTAKSLGMPLYNAIGNHDAFGVLAGSGVAPTDPLYGKKMYEDRMGKTYYSFDRKGYHFVVLDSIQPMPDRLWEARIDDAQLDWLRSDLKALAPGTPVIGVVHCPIVTAFGTYAAMVAAQQKYNTLTVANSPEVLEVLATARVLAVLQGHTHINELVEYNGIRFITSGAVCGNWWKGPRMGTPEGYSVITVHADGKVTPRYETYGFVSVAPAKGQASPSTQQKAGESGGAATTPPPK